MDQVDLVNPGMLGEFARLASCCRNLFVFLVLDQFVCFNAEFLQFFRNGGAQFGQVGDAERRCLSAALPVADFDEIVHDHFPDPDRIHGSVPAQLVQPVCVVPSDAGFRFLAGDHIVCVFVQHQAVFQRAHQAGIESDKIKFDAAVIQCLVDPGKGHRLSLAVPFVITVSAHASAAVVPEDQAHAVGREVVPAVFDKGCKRRRIRHARGPEILLKPCQASVLDLVNLVDPAVDHVVFPFPGPACKDDQVDFIAQLGIQHFLQVGGCHAVLALQVGAAHIDQDCHRVLVSAPDGRIFLACPCSNGQIGVRGVVFEVCREILLVSAAGGGCGRLCQRCGSAGSAACQAAEDAAEIICGIVAGAAHEGAEQVHQRTAARCTALRLGLGGDFVQDAAAGVVAAAQQVLSAENEESNHCNQDQDQFPAAAAQGGTGLLSLRRLLRLRRPCRGGPLCALLAALCRPLVSLLRALVSLLRALCSLLRTL